MKLVKKLVVWTLALVMVINTSITTLASANVSMYEGDSFSVVEGVDYADYEVSGSSSGHSETAHVLTFNPEDGYVPMAFAAYAGSCSTLETQYDIAVNKWFYYCLFLTYNCKNVMHICSFLQNKQQIRSVL